MTLRTPSIGSDAQSINWEYIFNRAFDRSLQFEPGDALKQGNLTVALKDLKKADNNGSAGRLIRRAVAANELRKTTEGFKIDYEGPSTGDIRKSLKTQLRETMRKGENGVIQSPTSSGKTYTPSTTRWRSNSDVTGDQPVILFSGTTDARDDALAKSQASWASAKALYGREDACPLARGDHDSGNSERGTAIRSPTGTEPSEWFSMMCDDKGLPLSVAHGEFARAHDGDLPCCENDDCLSSTQWTKIPRDDEGDYDYDVLHATHPFAQVPQLIDDCNLIIDERPDFTLNMTAGELKSKVNSYLQEIDAPVQRWEDLVVNIVTGAGGIDLDQLLEALVTPDTEWFRSDTDAHALTPGIVKAIVTAEERFHGRWVGETRYTYPTLIPHYDGPGHEVILRIVFNRDYDLRLLQAIPDFSEARSVIGLDAYPTMPKWRANTVPSIAMNRIVDSDDLHRWRRAQRNLTIVQVGENKNTWTRKDFNDIKVRILCDELKREYRDGFRTGITAKGSVDNLFQHLSDAGVVSPETLYYGNMKSVEDFDAEQAGLVAGCISPSSEDIKDWVALLNVDATPMRDVVDGHQGQEWVGDDADVAESLLADVRENGVLQACGRYARSPQQPDNRATVYVLTNVLPEEYVDKKIDDVSPLGKKEENILEYIVEHNGVTPREIDENIDASRKHIHETLNTYREEAWMRVEEIVGHNSPDKYYADRCPQGVVDV